MLRFVPLFLVLATSCAVPRSHREFSLSRQGGDQQQAEFASSTDLRVAGLVSEGLNFASKGRSFSAEGRLRQAAYLEPTNDRIAFNLAVIINQADQSEEAQQILERLVAKEPRNPNYLQALAETWLAQGRHDIAKDKLKEAFAIFKAAHNLPRAALIARSISNLAFGIGNEQEALCYSYEALTLTPSAEQASTHLRLLVGLNLFDEARAFAQERAALASEPLGLHAVAMAMYAKGEYQGALGVEESALARITKAPELTQELNVSWWLMKQRVPDQSEPSDATKEKMKELQESAVAFAERSPYEVVMWPVALRRELIKITSTPQ